MLISNSVATLEVPARLPTLKELIGYSIEPRLDTPISLNLLSNVIGGDQPSEENVVEAAKLESLPLKEDEERSRMKSPSAPMMFLLSAESDSSSLFHELGLFRSLAHRTLDNASDMKEEEEEEREKNEVSRKGRRRRTRVGSTELPGILDDVKPTTTRGTPPTTPSAIKRGFYVTKKISPVRREEGVVQTTAMIVTEAPEINSSKVIEEKLEESVIEPGESSSKDNIPSTVSRNSDYDASTSSITTEMVNNVSDRDATVPTISETFPTVPVVIAENISRSLDSPEVESTGGLVTMIDVEHTTLPWVLSTERLESESGSTNEDRRKTSQVEFVEATVTQPSKPVTRKRQRTTMLAGKIVGGPGETSTGAARSRKRPSSLLRTSMPMAPQTHPVTLKVFQDTTLLESTVQTTGLPSIEPTDNSIQNDDILTTVPLPAFTTIKVNINKSEEEKNSAILTDSSTFSATTTAKFTITTPSDRNFLSEVTTNTELMESNVTEDYSLATTLPTTTGQVPQTTVVLETTQKVEKETLPTTTVQVPQTTVVLETTKELEEEANKPTLEPSTSPISRTQSTTSVAERRKGFPTRVTKTRYRGQVRFGDKFSKTGQTVSQPPKESTETRGHLRPIWYHIHRGRRRRPGVTSSTTSSATTLGPLDSSLGVSEEPWRTTRALSEENKTIGPSRKASPDTDDLSARPPVENVTAQTVEEKVVTVDSILKSKNVERTVKAVDPIDGLENVKEMVDTVDPIAGLEKVVDILNTEVNLPRGIAGTTSGRLTTSRFRKPGGSSSTSALPVTSAASSTSSKLFGRSSGHRTTRPSDTTLSPGVTKDTLEQSSVSIQRSTVTNVRSDAVDQSSRAQELAVTLAEPPPSSQSSSGTGRTSLRDALRRRISTTIAPRTKPSDTANNGFKIVPILGQRRLEKESTIPERSSSTRATVRRRPAVLDYDYYEDEEVPIVGKSPLNGKLFLTSKGTIRCLDQGNFPHPFSCKKFITCARMVNGLVVGAEYTCPDKLSFDPVGGICNWSAGLGCRE